MNDTTTPGAWGSTARADGATRTAATRRMLVDWVGELPGSPENPMAWVSGIRALRRALCSPTRAKALQALDLLRIVASAHGQRVIRQRGWAPFIDVWRAALCSPTGSEELAVLRTLTSRFLAPDPLYSPGTLFRAGIGLTTQKLLLTEEEKRIFLNFSMLSEDPTCPIVACEPWGRPMSPRDPLEKELWLAFIRFRRRYPHVRCLGDILHPGFRYQGPGTIDGIPIDSTVIRELAAGRTGGEHRDLAAILLAQIHPGDAVYHHTLSLIQRSPNPLHTAVSLGFPEWLVDHENRVRRPLFLPVPGR
ncbi:hypothetical protein L1O03_10350 [Corynebacterium uropygiale]|uniref:Uncharacterized protein n=1 Tax=Corynebacterium uropygiale TaxID=1775911 RepID=A0A9X1TYQ6_9CORY|nr:hypothetical protein [Corynebacterium uropygiale]MCF4007565.1 hypothetical protein [Corynebacterium uropygiale]